MSHMPPTAFTTVMQDAFRRAGVRPAQERLAEIATKALIANAANWSAAQAAVLDAVKNDAALLWELLEPYRGAVVQKLLTQVAAEMRAAQRDGGGQCSRASHISAAPAVRLVPQPQSDRRVQPERPTAPRPSVAPRNPVVAAQAVADVVRLSMLDKFRANGIPIGDMTSEQANRWAVSQQRDVTFVRMLTANLPPTEPIRKYRTAEEADALYQKAKDEADV